VTGNVVALIFAVLVALPVSAETGVSFFGARRAPSLQQRVALCSEWDFYGLVGRQEL
jgi:hypothetical protein